MQNKSSIINPKIMHDIGTARKRLRQLNYLYFFHYMYLSYNDYLLDNNLATICTITKNSKIVEQKQNNKPSLSEDFSSILSVTISSQEGACVGLSDAWVAAPDLLLASSSTLVFLKYRQKIQFNNDLLTLSRC